MKRRSSSSETLYVKYHSEYLAKFDDCVFLDIPDPTESDKVDRFFERLKPEWKEAYINNKPMKFYDLVLMTLFLDKCKKVGLMVTKSRNVYRPAERSQLSSALKQKLQNGTKVFYLSREGHKATDCPHKRTSEKKQ